MATQRIDLIGYIGKDAVLRETPNGKSVSDFSLATTDRYNDETTWWKVTIWGALAAAVTQYLTKGTQVHVGGTMTNPQAQTYVNNAGDTVIENYSITARDLDLLGSGRTEPDSQDIPDPSATQEAPSNEIPF